MCFDFSLSHKRWFWSYNITYRLLTDVVLPIGRDGGGLPSEVFSLPPECLASFTSLICTLYIPGIFLSYFNVFLLICLFVMSAGCNSTTTTQPIRSPPCLSACTDVSSAHFIALWVHFWQHQSIIAYLWFVFLSFFYLGIIFFSFICTVFL